MKRGDRVLMLPPHQWKGETGDFDHLKQMAFGLRYVIELDNGTRCMAKDGEFQEISKEK